MRTPDNVTPDTMLRLEAAAALAFPDGSMSAGSPAASGHAGHLTIYRIAGKDFTTLNDIEEMKTACRVPAKRPDCGSDQPAKTGPKSTSSSMAARKQALAAAKATLREPNVLRSLPQGQARPEGRRGGGDPNAVKVADAISTYWTENIAQSCRGQKPSASDWTTCSTSSGSMSLPNSTAPCSASTSSSAASSLPPVVIWRTWRRRSTGTCATRSAVQSSNSARFCLMLQKHETAG